MKTVIETKVTEVANVRKGEAFQLNENDIHSAYNRLDSDSPYLNAVEGKVYAVRQGNIVEFDANLQVYVLDIHS